MDLLCDDEVLYQEEPRPDSDEDIVALDDYDPTTRTWIGDGTYGKVYQVNIGGNVFAEKKYKSDECHLHELEQFMKDEVRILLRIRPKTWETYHKNIVFYAGCDPQQYCLYFEVLEKISSAVYKDATSVLELNAFINSMVRDVSCGLKYLESRGVVHMDLKQNNIMRRVRGSTSEFVLIDFGMAQLLDDEGQVKDREWDFPPAGTYLFQSPEVLRMTIRHGRKEPPGNLFFTANQDVYSLGLLAYFFASSQTYYNGSVRKKQGMECLTHLLRTIEYRRRINFLKDMQALEEEKHIEAAGIIRQMLEPNHRARLYACDVYERMLKLEHQKCVS